MMMWPFTKKKKVEQGTIAQVDSKEKEFLPSPGAVVLEHKNGVDVKLRKGPENCEIKVNEYHSIELDNLVVGTSDMKMMSGKATFYGVLYSPKKFTAKTGEWESGKECYEPIKKDIRRHLKVVLGSYTASEINANTPEVQRAIVTQVEEVFQSYGIRIQEMNTYSVEWQKNNVVIVPKVDFKKFEKKCTSQLEQLEDQLDDYKKSQNELSKIAIGENKRVLNAVKENKKDYSEALNKISSLEKMLDENGNDISELTEAVSELGSMFSAYVKQQLTKEQEEKGRPKQSYLIDGQGLTDGEELIDGDYSHETVSAKTTVKESLDEIDDIIEEIDDTFKEPAITPDVTKVSDVYEPGEELADRLRQLDTDVRERVFEKMAGQEAVRTILLNSEFSKDGKGEYWRRVLTASYEKCLETAYDTNKPFKEVFDSYINEGKLKQNMEIVQAEMIKEAVR
jgi:hypothetical protein